MAAGQEASHSGVGAALASAASATSAASAAWNARRRAHSDVADVVVVGVVGVGLVIVEPGGFSPGYRVSFTEFHFMPSKKH